MSSEAIVEITGFFIFFIFVVIISILAGLSSSNNSVSSDRPVKSYSETGSYEYDGPSLCAGACVGPHLNLSTGEVSMFSNGPGLEIF